MNILVLIDFSPLTPRLVEQAKMFAKALDSRVWLLHVAHPDPDFVGYKAGPGVVREQVAKEFNNEHHQIQSIADELRSLDIDASALLIQGVTVDAILGQVGKLGIDLIVAGHQHHSKLYRSFMGDITAKLLDKVACPVLLVPEH